MPSPAVLPTVPKEKLLESASRPIFEQAVAPWLVTHWMPHDYGIDALVEITRSKTPGGDFTATGKRFAVQLKATNLVATGSSVTVRARPSQIRYWLESTEPVALVVCHVPTRSFVWRWVTADLVEELTMRDASWAGQETVSISIPTTSVLDDRAREDIAALVCGFRPRSSVALSPGTYRRLQSTLTAIARKLLLSAESTTLTSVANRIRDLETALRRSTYVVAITGPARAGKSTLLNALLRRDLSPTGKLPTTAVSIMVVAGERDEAEVLFTDGTSKLGEANATFLEEFATLDRNPHNVKSVRLVTVRLVDEMLEHGVAYVDAPGLHDPSAAIRDVTKAALSGAQAVLYVLDVSSAREGGFSLASYHVDDLERLRSIAQRLFIVLNKADALDGEERAWVGTYLEERLKEHGLWDALPQPPMFLSAKAALISRLSDADGTTALQPLHDAVWHHLLATNNTGLDRLAVATTELERASAELLTLMAVRRLDGSEAFRLRAALRACEEQERSLLRTCAARAVADEAFARRHLRQMKDDLIRDLRDRLEQLLPSQPLPKEAALQAELRKASVDLFTDVWREMMARFQVFASHISDQVETSLHQARLASGTVTGRLRLPDVPPLRVPQDSFAEAWRGLFAGGFLAALIGAPGAWVLAAGGWIAGLLMGRQAQRRRQLNKIVEHVGDALEQVTDAVIDQVGDKIRIYSASLQRHVRDRISVFVHDADDQLAHLGEPLTPDDVDKFAGVEETVQHTLCTLELVRRESAMPVTAGIRDPS